MKFIVQHNLMNSISLEKISNALINQNIPHEFVGIIPFSHEISSDYPLDGTDYLPYGSTLMTMLTCKLTTALQDRNIVSEGLNWRGNYFDPDTFRSDIWNIKRDDMLNSGDVTMNILDAIAFLKKQDPKSMWFTRPCEDLKQFSGQVIEAEECWKWLEDAMKCESSGSYKLSPETMIVVAEPKNIQAEWRWFIIAGKVISGSMYRRMGETYNKQELDHFVIYEAQVFANQWLPHKNCVMDLALVDGEVKVIEFNTINSSGFYDHDVEAIIEALWRDFNED